MQQSEPSNNQPNAPGGYKLTVKPGESEKLLVAICRPDEPTPRYAITCEPDDDAVAYHLISTEHRDGRIKYYYYFENFGLVAATVTMRRTR